MMLLENYLKRQEIASDVGGDYTLLLDLHDHGLQSTFYYFLPEYYEPETQRYIKENLKPEMIVLDVGAHIGFFTMLLASQIGKDGRVFAFEPDEKNFKRILLNIQYNQFKNVIPYQMALSNNIGKTYLSHHTTSSGHRLKSVIPLEVSTNEKVSEISETTLDEFMSQHQLSHVDFMKLDAEKSELLILEGGKNTFRDKKISSIICEIHSSKNSSLSEHDKVREAFYDYGYKSFTLNEKLSHKPYLSELLPHEKIKGLQNILFNTTLLSGRFCLDT